MPVDYLPHVFSESVYRQIANKLSGADEEMFRRELLRLETQTARIAHRVWDDVHNQKVRVVIVTQSGRKFCLNGVNWPTDYEDNLPEPVGFRTSSLENVAGPSDTQPSAPTAQAIATPSKPPRARKN